LHFHLHNKIPTQSLNKHKKVKLDFISCGQILYSSNQIFW